MGRPGFQGDDIYSDVDSEEFVQDMRAYGVGQALALDVRHNDPAVYRILVCSV